MEEPLKEERLTAREKREIRSLAKASHEALVSTLEKLRAIEAKRLGAKGSTK